jgi:hypothetical protein
MLGKYTGTGIKQNSTKNFTKGENNILAIVQRQEE